MAQDHRRDAGPEFETDDFDCDPELATFLESDADERGEEAALGLIRFTARLADVDPDDVDEVFDPQFHHELMHSLTGFLGGMLTAIRSETDIDDGNLGTALFRVVNALDLDEADDADKGAVVTELEDESLASFVELARVSGVPDAADTARELVGDFERSIEAMIDDATKRSGDQGSPPHVTKAVLIMEVMRGLAERLRAVPDIGFGLLRVTLASIDEATTQEQEGAKNAAVTEGPAAIRRAQVKARNVAGKSAIKTKPRSVPAPRAKKADGAPPAGKPKAKSRR